MAVVLSLETDERFNQQIETSLKVLSSHIEFKTFTTLDEINKYCSSLSSPKKNDDHHAVFILSAELLPQKPMEWIRSLRNQLRNLGHGTAENPPRFLITAFEDTQFQFKEFEQPEVFNYFFKPCDPLILKENLGFALAGYQQLRGQEIKFRTVSDKLEMLKQIHFDEICEVGFVTTSDTEFKPGVVSKYYSPFFESGNRSYAFGRLISCKPHPQKPAMFQCLFEYLGIDSLQLTAMRKKIAAMAAAHRKGDVEFPWYGNHHGKPERPFVKIFIAIEDEPTRRGLVDSLQRNWTNIQIEEYYLERTHKESITAVVCDIAILDDNRNTEAMHRLFEKDVIKLLYTQQKPSEVSLRDHLAIFEDVLCSPLDRAYLNKKLKLLANSLKFKEAPTPMPTLHGGFAIKAVMPVQITQASENHVEFSYSRALSMNELREFAIHGEEAMPHIEVKGRCHFISKSSTKDLPFSHQFLLLGQKDYFTKQIRLWLHRLYVSEAEKKL